MRALPLCTAVITALILACSGCSSDEDNTGVGSTGGAGTGGSSAGGSGAVAGGGNGGAPTGGASSTTAATAVSSGTGFEAEVLCGDATCNGASPICCVIGGAKSCVAYMGSLSCGGDPTATTMACDDHDDCLGGQTCCVNTSAPAGGISYTCAYAPCATHESCLPGGTCAGGATCVVDAAQASGGKCM